jgi:Animal haem peroxidase
MKDVTSSSTVRTEHGRATREMTFQAIEALSGHGDPGKFGRMFPMLPALDVGDDALFDLAQAMRDPDPASTEGDNPDIPAGYTYLAQFIDHDITLDLTPLDEQKTDPLGTRNFRTPALDLDSIYGPGPALAPYMYQRGPDARTIPKLLIGRTAQSSDPQGETIPGLSNDLPRNGVGRAIIGDERNDENLLVAQTHLAFLKFHNAVFDQVRDRMAGASQDAVFAEAQRVTLWHYQWIVLFDFVERLTEPGLVARIRREGRRFYRFRTTPYIPAEFSGAAYRLGHSMIRESYDHNRVFNDEARFRATLAALFDFTGKSGVILGDDAEAADELAGISGVPAQEALPSNWVIDWRRFYHLPGSEEVGVNLSRRIDPFLTPALAALPGETDRSAMLAFRNLRRGVNLGLPSGQDVASIMGLAPLEPAEIATGPDGAVAAVHGLHERTPLWYYILKEAEVAYGGRRLGPVGSTIVAETFLGLVHGDHASFLWQRSDWTPELPSAEPGTFTMSDLLVFVGDIAPIG